MNQRLIVIISVLLLSTANFAFAQSNLDDTSIESLSPTERIDRARKSIDRMKRVRDNGVSLLEKTRREERDIIKLNCINNKLSAVKGFLKVAEQAFVELQEDIDEKDEQGQIHQSKLVQLAERRVTPLGDEMAGCAGDVIQYTGPTNFNVNIDDNIRQDNPDDLNIDGLDGLDFDLPGGTAQVYTIIFKNSDGETKKLHLTCTPTVGIL